MSGDGKAGALSRKTQIVRAARKTYKRFVAALAFGALMLSVASAQAVTIVTRTETKAYIGPVADVALTCNAAGTQVNLGGACFQVQSVDKTAAFTVNDENSSGVLAGFGWYRSNGTFIPPFTNVCGGASNLTIPTGATQFVVMVGVDVGSVLNGQCGTSRGTKGTITSSFSHPVP